MRWYSTLMLKTKGTIGKFTLSSAREMFSILLMNFELLIPSLLMREGEDESDILFLHLRDRFGDRFFLWLF